MNAYLQNAAAMNALDPQTAAYYQNYYQQYYGQQGAAGMQQYYGQAYNYNQTAAAYGQQGYNAYANYGYNTATGTQNYATTQQQKLQQLQQQLQPTNIQQAVPTQTTQTQAQNPPQAQTLLPGLGGTSSINPAVTVAEKKASTEIVTEQPVAGKTMELEAVPVVQENKVEETKDQMVLEEKSKIFIKENFSQKIISEDEGKEENKINEEVPADGANAPTASGENAIVEEKKEEKKVLTKAEIEKNKRKQIELEMKKWEREQVRFFSFELFSNPFKIANESSIWKCTRGRATTATSSGTREKS